MAANTIRRFGQGLSTIKFSPDGATIFALDGVGAIDRYDAATGSFLGHAFQDYNGISGFDLSPDGRFLVATSWQVTGEVSSGNTSARDVSVFRVDLTTGSVNTYTTRVFNETGAFTDVEFLPSGQVLLSNRGSSDTSGAPVPLTLLDLTTGTFTTSTVSLPRYSTITSSADGSLQLAQGYANGTQTAVLDAQGALVARRNSYADGVVSYSAGLQAISAAKNMVLLGNGDVLNLHDTNLVLQRNLLPQLKDEMGAGYLKSITFSIDGNSIYGLNPVTQAVYEFSTTDWTIQRAFAIGENVGQDLSARTATFVISPDGHYLTLDGPGPTLRVDLTTSNQISGDGSANQLTGTDYADFILGLGGNDVLQGGVGSDTLVGGDGDDTYIIGPSGPGLSNYTPDIVVERAGGGNDVVITSTDFALPTNVETIRLAPGAIATITSNDQGGTLIGNDFGTLLIGRGGAETFIGGKGDDTFQSGDGGFTSNGDVAVFDDVLANARFEFAYGGEFRTRTTLLYVISADGRDDLGAIGGVGPIGNFSGGIGTLRFNDASIGTKDFRAINEAFTGYAGRPATTSEIIRYADLLAPTSTYADARGSLLADATFRALVDAQITAPYLDFFGRPPAADEIATWENLLFNFNYKLSDIRQTIINDPLGDIYTGGRISQIYVDYAGRPATDGEIDYWQRQLIVGQDGYAGVRHAILVDPIGQSHSNVTIDALYQEYGGRGATNAETSFWRGQLLGGTDFAGIRNAILVDQLGQTHSAATIDALYQEYGGRAATGDEIAFWKTQLLGGNGFAAVRNAILDDPLGQTHTTTEVGSLYQEYFGRTPGGGELDVWRGLIRDGASFGTLTDALMSDAGSNGIVEKLSGTAAPDRFDLGTGLGHVTITSFDANADQIDLRGTPFSGRDPLVSGHAIQVTAVDGSSDVLLRFSDHDSILLHNVQLTQLNSADFLF